MENNVTVIIKTMLRPKSLKKLINSILKLYPNITILIGDDGRPSCKEYILNEFENKNNIYYYELPYDSGLSYGRNYLLQKVKTEYFLLCDDDFEIDNTLNLVELINILENKKLDILGGYLRNYKIVRNFKDKIIVLLQKVLKYEIKTNYIGSFETNNDILNVYYNRYEFPNYIDTELCLNFFLAKTSSIKKMNGWDEDLKLQEHTEFFYRAKLNGIKVGFSNQMSVKHFPVQMKNYKNNRLRNYTHIFLKKYNFSEIRSFYKGENNKNFSVSLDKDNNIKIKNL